MKYGNNRLRAFTDVVSVDAWHDDFAENNARARIFCDVAFRTSRVGADPDSPVRFRLSLKRAEIHLIVPKGEPIRIDRETVARTLPENPRVRTVTVERSKEASVEAEAKGDISVDSTVKGKLGLAGAQKHGDKERDFERIEEEKKEFTLSVFQNKSSDGNYRWEVQSNDFGPLVGKPWSPEEPRATLIDTSGQSKYGLIPGGIRFDAICAREDLIIEDVQIKDRNIMKRFFKGIIPKKKEMIVVQYIKDQLIRHGLEADSIDDEFGLFVITSVVASE